MLLYLSPSCLSYTGLSSPLTALMLVLEVCAISLLTELFAHAMVVLEHALEGRQVELIVIGSELTKRDGAVLVDDASHLNYLTY